MAVDLVRLPHGDLESSLPSKWDDHWGEPSPFFRRQLRELKRGFEYIASDIELDEPGAELASLVHPQANAAVPVHRWYQYKEAFSHRLPHAVVARLGAGDSRVVADVFGGVATSALALQLDPRVARVISVEYSPLAHLVGRTKLRWHELSPTRLRRVAAAASRFRPRRTEDIPDLSAFHNEDIFKPAVVAELIAARRQINSLDIPARERDFLTVGLAAIVEDCSGVMKDGRALRIVRDRRRRRSSLAARDRDDAGALSVRQALTAQWNSMIDDLENLARQRRAVDRGKSVHLRGDARHLDKVRAEGDEIMPSGTVGLHAYSPPYLNCIDYTEVYKLELWALGLVASQAEFRNLRLGSLRSHPSVEFPSRPYFDGLESTQVVHQVHAIASFLERNHARAGIGRMVRNYFADMTQVLREQHRTLEPGGTSVCIVGNSTFSRRDVNSRGRVEQWRVPMLTDVLIGGLALELGFESAEIWPARDLRPRNVDAGTARESFVILRKPR
jgi:hypothetical protein